MEVVPKEYLAEGVECLKEVEVMRFYQEALKLGLEGIIVKSLNSTYIVDQRTDTWLKFKPERDTVDAVIVKALYGKGEKSVIIHLLFLLLEIQARKNFTL